MIWMKTFFASALLLLPGFAHAGIEPPVLRASLESEPITLDWTAARSSTDRFIAFFLMRGLLTYDSANQLVCDLCKSYSTSADGKTLSFELGATEVWSDGVKLEAQHFVDSFHRAGSRFKQLSKASALGKSRLELTLSKADALFPHALTTVMSFPIRKEFVKKGNSSGEEHAFSAVLGPYQLAEWERGKRIVLEGNPKYTGVRPVYRVDFVLGTHDLQIQRFKAGKLDILSNPTNADIMRFSGQRLQMNPYWATRMLVMNVRHASVSELSLRRAMLLSLDRETLPGFLGNGERKVTGLIPPGMPGYRDLPLTTGDLPQAQKERGKMPGGTVNKRVTLSLLARDQDTDRKVAEWLGSRFEKIQVQLKPLFRGEVEYFGDLEAGRFDLALVTRGFMVASPLEILRSFETQHSENRGHWTHVGFDALMGQLLKTANPTEFASLVDRTTQMVEAQEVAAIPLGYPTQPFLLGPRVISFAITPFGDPDLIKIQLRQQ